MLRVYPTILSDLIAQVVVLKCSGSFMPQHRQYWSIMGFHIKRFWVTNEWCWSPNLDAFSNGSILWINYWYKCHTSAVLVSCSRCRRGCLSRNGNNVVSFYPSSWSNDWSHCFSLLKSEFLETSLELFGIRDCMITLVQSVTRIYKKHYNIFFCMKICWREYFLRH